MARALLEVYRSVLPGRKAWYVSTPITTGRRLHGLRMRNSLPGPKDYQDFLQEHVIEPNLREARKLVRHVRRGRDRIVIDPSSVGDIPAWGQDDYRYFWELVIREFVQCVVFAKGWEYSSGCSYEFLAAVQAGVKTLDDNLKPLSRVKGILLLQQAVTAALNGGADAGFLQAVLDSLAQGPVSVS